MPYRYKHVTTLLLNFMAIPPSHLHAATRSRDNGIPGVNPGQAVSRDSQTAINLIREYQGLVPIV